MWIKPHFKVIIAAILLGSSGAFIKGLAMPVVLITFLRMAVPASLLLVCHIINGSTIKTDGLRWMMLASLLNAFRMLLFFFGFTYATIGNSIILLYTWPIFATIFSAFFLKEKVTTGKMAAIVLALQGILLIHFDMEFSLRNNEILGMLSVLLSAVVYSMTVIIFKKESVRFNHWETVFYQNILGAIIFLPFAFPFFSSTSPVILGGGIFYALLIGIVGFGLFFSALKHIPASNASLITYMEVPSAFLFAIILFNEAISWSLAAGGLLILISTFIVNRKS